MKGKTWKGLTIDSELVIHFLDGDGCTCRVEDGLDQKTAISELKQVFVMAANLELAKPCWKHPFTLTSDDVIRAHGMGVSL